MNKKVVKREMSAMIYVAIFFSVLTLLAFTVNGQSTHSQARPPGEQPNPNVERFISPHFEIINTLEDCIEWMRSDVEEGMMEGFLAEIYINQFNNVILSLENTPAVTYKQHQYDKEYITKMAQEKDCSSKDE